MHYAQRSTKRARLGGFVCAVAAGLFGTLVSSCSSSENRPALTVAIALLPSERPVYAQLLQDFTDSTGIGVSLVAQQYQQIREALQAEAAAGRGELDVVEFDVYFLPKLETLVQPLDTLVHTLGDLGVVVNPDAWAAGLRSGAPNQVMFVPHRLNWQAMIYDAERLPEPPKTWDELRAVASKYPASIGIKGARYEGLVCDFFPFLWQAGGDPLHPEAPAALEALTLMAKLRQGISPNSISFKENTVLQAQEHQEILLHFNWPFAVPLLRERGLLPGRIRTAPLPRGPQGSATVLGGGYLGIPRTAPHPEEAGLLLEFLTSETVQRRLLKELGWFPPRPGAWEALDDEARRAAEGFFAMKTQVRARPLVRDYDAISDLWQTAVANVLFNNIEPQEAIRRLTQSLRERAHAPSER